MRVLLTDAAKMDGLQFKDLKTKDAVKMDGPQLKDLSMKDADAKFLDLIYVWKESFRRRAPLLNDAMRSPPSTEVILEVLEYFFYPRLVINLSFINYSGVRIGQGLWVILRHEIWRLFPLSVGADATVTTGASHLKTTVNLTASNRKESLRIFFLKMIFNDDIRFYSVCRQLSIMVLQRVYDTITGTCRPWFRRVGDAGFIPGN